MANEFDYLSIIADKDVVDPTYDISNIRTTTPTSERLLAAVPEYPGLRYDPTQQSVFSDLYNFYRGGGLDASQINFVTPPADTTPVDTNVVGGDTGITATSAAQTMGGVNTPFEQNLINQSAGVQIAPGQPVVAPGEMPVTQAEMDAFNQLPVNTEYKSPSDTGDANVAEQFYANQRATKARADEQAAINREQYMTGEYTPTETYAGGERTLADAGAIEELGGVMGPDYQGEEYIEPQSMLASDMIEAQKASMPKGRAALGTIDRTPASQALDDEYYDFDTVDPYADEYMGMAPEKVQGYENITPEAKNDWDQVRSGAAKIGDFITKYGLATKNILEGALPIGAIVQPVMSSLTGESVSNKANIGGLNQEQADLVNNYSVGDTGKDEQGYNIISMLTSPEEYIEGRIERGLPITDADSEKFEAKTIARDDKIDAGIKAADEEPSPITVDDFDDWDDTSYSYTEPTGTGELTGAFDVGAAVEKAQADKAAQTAREAARTNQYSSPAPKDDKPSGPPPGSTATPGRTGHPSGGDAPGGGGKIVCTMMNESYGFGSFRNKIWLRHSKDLAPEYQIGYHKIFLPLVRLSKTNKLLKKTLEHIAVHRTIDIRQEARGKKHLLGRIYRKILEPICYWVGKYAKR